MSGVMVLDKPYLNLKSIIVSKGMKQKEIAEQLDMDKSTFNMKVNRYRGRDFTFSEASKLSKLLDIKMEDFQYFFRKKVAKTITYKGYYMNELKIREDGIYLNNQKLKGVQAIKTKSTAESNHATVYLKFIAKLI